LNTGIVAVCVQAFAGAPYVGVSFWRQVGSARSINRCSGVLGGGVAALAAAVLSGNAWVATWRVSAWRRALLAYIGVG
jgi:hypothetical protein